MLGEQGRGVGREGRYSLCGNVSETGGRRGCGFQGCALLGATAQNFISQRESFLTLYPLLVFHIHHRFSRSSKPSDFEAICTSTESLSTS